MTQEEVALAMSSAGVGWRRSTVGAIEGGSRGVAIDEIVLLSTIFAKPSLDWWVGAEQGGATHRTAAAQDVLRSVADLLDSSPVARVAEVDARAARRLFLKPVDLAKRAEDQWGHSLLDEREHRLANRVAGATVTEAQLRALRGRITRELIDEMSASTVGTSTKG
jgi:hypothetical protein